MNNKNIDDSGATNNTSIIQRLSALKEILSGLVISKLTSDKTVFYDQKSKHFITLAQNGEITFSTIYRVEES